MANPRWRRSYGGKRISILDFRRGKGARARRASTRSSPGALQKLLLRRDRELAVFVVELSWAVVRFGVWHGLFTPGAKARRGNGGRGCEGTAGGVHGLV